VEGLEHNDKVYLSIFTRRKTRDGKFPSVLPFDVEVKSCQCLDESEPVMGSNVGLLQIFVTRPLASHQGARG